MRIRSLLSIVLFSLVLIIASPGLAFSIQKPMRIHLWEQDPPELGAEIDNWIKVYTRDKPWLQIVRQHFENEELRTRFLRSAVTGDGADILYGPSDLLGVLLTAGVIQPLPDDFPKAAYDPQLVRLMTQQGKLWGAPISGGSHLLLYYNRKLVQQPPKTMEDLIIQGQRFMKAGQGRYGLAYFQSEPFWFVPFMGAFGAWPLSHDDKKVEIQLDQAGTIQALEFVKSLRDEQKIIPRDCDFECARTLFFQEKAPFHINGDWEISALQEQFGEYLGIAPLPVLERTKAPMTPMVGGRFFFLNANLSEEKKEVLVDFMRFTSSLPVQTRIATHLTRIPATIEARKHPLVAVEPAVQALIASMEHGRDFPPDVEMRAAWDGMRIMMQRALSGRESSTQAAKTGQQASDEALRALIK